MRTAIISDIHGNFDGLLAVLADIERAGCDRIICLGDLVDGGAQSVEVVGYLREHGIRTVRGNHDAEPHHPLPLEIEAYLRDLPTDIVEGGTLFTHSSPRAKRTKIVSSFEAWNVFDECDFRRIFVGDIHIPLIYGEKCEEQVSAKSYPISYEEFSFAADDRYIVCVGAVGYSRDPYRWLRYAIYDDVRDSVTFRAPEGPILVF